MDTIRGILARPFFSMLIQRGLSLLNAQPHVGLCLLTVSSFFILKNGWAIFHGSSLGRLIFLAFIIGVCFSFRKLRMVELPHISSTTLRGISILFAFYILFASPTLVADVTPLPFVVEAHLYRWLGGFLFILGCWRPAWLLTALVALRWQKYVVEDLAGMTISFTDYGPVLEFGITLTLGAMVWYYGRQWVGAWRVRDDNQRLTVLEAVFLTAVAVHFSNYFYSGLQKIIISDPWWQWVTDNPTYYLMLSAWETGQLPLTYFSPEITGRLYELFVKYIVPLNVLTLALQLGAIIAILRIRWAAVMTAMYDVTHVIIFITSGIFFYKWIWLNLLIVYALALISHKRIDNLLKVWLITIMLVAPGSFFVARLGWFDSPSFNDEYVVAFTADGDGYRVPTNYFFSPSITHAQQRLVKEKPGFFLTGAYGSIYEKVLPYLSFEDAQNCVLNESSSKGISEAAAQRNLSKYLRNHHMFVLQHVNDEGRVLYDAYPHHIFSMYWDFEDFYKLDKRSIVRYEYVVEANCLTYRDGRPHHLTLKRESYNVPVDPLAAALKH